jgi:hypothetical protein
MSIVQAYASRSKQRLWFNMDEFHLVQGGLADMTLNELGTKKEHRNKIKLQTRAKKPVIKFTPRLSSSQDSFLYPECCRVSLVRYKAWSTT